MTINIISKTSNAERYSRVSLDDVVTIIRDGKYAGEVAQYRGYGHPVNGLPSVCFGAEYAKYKGRVDFKGYNALVLLEVNNLPDIDTAVELRQAVAKIPYTCLTFVGATGRDVKIVCRAVSYQNTVPTDEKDAAVFHHQAYRRLHYIYSAQLGITVDRLEPTLRHRCSLSSDGDVFYRADSMPVLVSEADEDMPDFTQPRPAISDYETELGMAKLYMLRKQYTSCVRDACEKSLDEEDASFRSCKMIQKLAENCHETGLPMAYAVKMTLYKTEFFEMRDFVEDTFNEVYRTTLKSVSPYKYIKPSALLTYRTEAFLNANYDLRLNVMTGVAQYRSKDNFNFTFQDLTKSVRNTMAIRALKAGLESWDKDITRYIESTMIPEYDPVNDYLDHLPRWDGRDRVETMADRIRTADKEWRHRFHVWMLSTVAHWMGKDRQHGNAIVPLLIGRQGSRKTTFCGMILPPALRDYYNDKIEIKSDTALNLSLTSFALINIDEFDSLSPTKHPLLKYILSSSEVKMRPPYGKAFEVRRRYASFIATTNNDRPLTDPTGSRRFICVEADEIDTDGRTDYQQLYAQLKQEILDGERYWFTDEETALLMAHNLRFQRVDDYMQMIRMTFETPDSSMEGDPHTLDDILETLERKFPTFRRLKTTSLSLGRCLTDMGYVRRKTKTSNQYIIQEK